MKATEAVVALLSRAKACLSEGGVAGDERFARLITNVDAYDYLVGDERLTDLVSLARAAYFGDLPSWLELLQVARRLDASRAMPGELPGVLLPSGGSGS